MTWYKSITVEVPLLLFTFGIMLHGSLFTNLYMYRTCYTILGYAESNCSQLGNKDNAITKELEPLVQPYVNKINMVQTVVMSTVPLIFCLYVGTWSDKFGRKPFIILGLLGSSLSSAIAILLVHFKDVVTWWFLIGTVPSLITGGFTTIFLSISSYIADVSTPQNRAFRLTIFEIIMMTSSFAGNFLSTFLFYRTGYETVFTISTSLTVLACIYTFFFIPESLEKKEKVPKFTKLFKYISFSDILKTTFRKRENNARPYILVVLGLMVLSGFSMGEMNVTTLFFRAKFSWTLTKITYVSSITSVGNILGTIIGTTVLTKILKIKELPIAFLSILLSLGSNILRGIATDDTYIYIAYGLSAFRGLFGIMIRTILSYMVEPAEMGKIFAVQSVLQSICDTVSSLIYTSVYTATLKTNSAIFNFLTAGVNVIVAAIILFMMRLTFPYRHTSPTEADAQQENTKFSININNFETLAIDSNRNSLTGTGSKKSSLLIGMEVLDTRTLSLR